MHLGIESPIQETSHISDMFPPFVLGDCLRHAAKSATSERPDAEKPEHLKLGNKQGTGGGAGDVSSLC